MWSLWMLKLFAGWWWWRIYEKARGAVAVCAGLLVDVGARTSLHIALLYVLIKTRAR